MKKVEKIYVYNNNKLYLILVNKYGEIPLIVYEKEIDRFRISDIRKSSYLEGVKNKIIRAEKEIEKNFSDILNKTLPKLILTTDSLEIRREQFGTEFDQKCEVNKEDIKRIIKKGMEELQMQIPDDYQITEYKIISYILDGNIVDSIYGKKVQDVRLVVDVLITDSKTVNELQSLFSSVNLIFDNKYLIDYRILKRLKGKSSIIIDINYEINKVFVKDQNNLYINYLNTGLGTILNKLYDYFKKEYDDQKAEEITRFVKQNWILNTYEHECDTIKGVEIKKVIKITREIFLQYFKLLFSRFGKFDKFYIICDELFEKEFIKFLNLNFDFEIKPAFPNDLLISSIIDNKVGYCLNEIYEGEV